MHVVNPNHLDVIECWKGLSHTQALELALWYQFLYHSLHTEVEESLTEGLVKDLSTRSGKSLFSSTQPVIRLWRSEIVSVHESRLSYSVSIRLILHRTDRRGLFCRSRT